MNPSETDNKPREKPQIGRREIGAFLLLLVINWAFVLLFFGASARQRVTIPYSPTFLAQVQAGNVSTVTAQDAAIQGTLKQAIRYPARDKNVKATTEFATRVPDFADTKALDTLLQEKGVVITAKAPPGTPFWQTLLAGFLPTLLFFGLWYWIMRRSGSGSSTSNPMTAGCMAAMSFVKRATVLRGHGHCPTCLSDSSSMSMMRTGRVGSNARGLTR